MTSLEDDKLLQMVHDFIECESTCSSTNTCNSSSIKKNPAHFRQSTRFFTLQEILNKMTQEERKIQEQIGEHMKNKMGMEEIKGLKQWLVKCLMLDGLHASIRHISWVTTPSCPCGSYEYIEIVEKDAKGDLVTLIVDINFKSQFEVARPTQSYKELLGKVPSIFVGNEAKLNSIITVLCSASKESLREQGLHIPPWRRANYMLSKWNLSRYNTDSNTGNNDDDYINDNSNCSNSHHMVTDGISRRVQMRVGWSGLSNQFPKKSINCC